MNYYDIYLKRVNRYGNNFAERLQNKREQEFEQQLRRSVYYINFDIDGATQEGELTPYKQDETETLHYLLTRVDLKIPEGTILFLPSDVKDKDTLHPWLVYYREKIKATGYNKYIMLKMTHLIKWVGRDGEEHSTWAYFYSQEDNMLKDEIRSRSRMDTIYGENLKMSFFITPVNEHIRKDDYFEIGEGALKEAFKVTGYDLHSSAGVEYVTVDPIYLMDHSPAPKQTAADSEEDFFWINMEG